MLSVMSGEQLDARLGQGANQPLRCLAGACMSRSTPPAAVMARQCNFISLIKETRVRQVCPCLVSAATAHAACSFACVVLQAGMRGLRQQTAEDWRQSARLHDCNQGRQVLCMEHPGCGPMECWRAFNRYPVRIRLSCPPRMIDSSVLLCNREYSRSLDRQMHWVCWQYAMAGRTFYCQWNEFCRNLFGIVDFSADQLWELVKAWAFFGPWSCISFRVQFNARASGNFLVASHVDLMCQFFIAACRIGLLLFFQIWYCWNAWLNQVQFHLDDKQEQQNGYDAICGWLYIASFAISVTGIKNAPYTKAAEWPCKKTGGQIDVWKHVACLDDQDSFYLYLTWCSMPSCENIN